MNTTKDRAGSAKVGRTLRSRSSCRRQSKLDIKVNVEDTHAQNCLLRTIAFKGDRMTSDTSLWEAWRIVNAIKPKREEMLNNSACVFGKSVREMEFIRSSIKTIEESVQFYDGVCCKPFNIQETVKLPELEISCESSQEEVKQERRVVPVPLPYKGNRPTLFKNRCKRLKRPHFEEKDKASSSLAVSPLSSLAVSPSSSLAVSPANISLPSLAVSPANISLPSLAVSPSSSLAVSPAASSSNTEAAEPFFSSTPKRRKMVTESAYSIDNAKEADLHDADNSSTPAAFFAFTPKISPIVPTRPKINIRRPTSAVSLKHSAKEEQSPGDVRKQLVFTSFEDTVDWDTADSALVAFPTNNESKNSSGIPSLAERDLLAYLEHNSGSFNNGIL